MMIALIAPLIILWSKSDVSSECTTWYKVIVAFYVLTPFVMLHQSMLKSAKHWGVH